MSKGGDLLGGLFDFNGDGKTDLGEEYMAYRVWEECMKDAESDSDSFFGGSDDYDWRDY